MMSNPAFACKVVIFDQKAILASPDKEILQELYNIIYSEKKIPDNDANVLVVFGKCFEQLDNERCNNMLKIFDEIADTLINPNRNKIPNCSETFLFDSEALQKKLKNASFVFVQKEDKDFLGKFRDFCREITGRDNQKGEIFEKHWGSEILEKTRDLANFFLDENAVCLEKKQCQSLQLLKTKFRYNMMVLCTKPSSAIPYFRL